MKKIYITLIKINKLKEIQKILESISFKKQIYLLKNKFKILKGDIR